MTLAAIRDLLAEMRLADAYGIGRINDAQERSVGVYDRAGRGAPVTAIGGAGSYGIRPVRILYHGTENAAATEDAARRIWDAVTAIRRNGGVLFARPMMTGPAAVGTDRSGIYEYIMDFDVYYTK